MNWKNVDLFLLISVLALITFSIPTLSINGDRGQRISQFDLMTSDFSWNTSDYVNFHGPLINAGSYTNFRIYINDENPAYNWSKTEAENDWCTGSGTWNDPYIIENLYIKGNGSGGMILIKWSKKHFNIRNCWFDYSGSAEYDVGVCIQHAGNGTVENNIFTYTHKGVVIQLGSENHNINNNIMISDHVTAGFGRAIELGSESHNNIISNIKIRNYYHAIYISLCNNITLRSNYAENNIWGKDFNSYPMDFHQIYSSKFIYNVLAGDFAQGSFLINEVSCSGNVVENNTVLAGDPWVFGPPQSSGTIALSFPALKLQQATENIVNLEHSNNNYIAHNILLKFGASSGPIYSYNIFLLLGSVCFVSIILLVIIRKKHLK